MYETIIDALRRNAGAEALSAAQAMLVLHPDDAQAHRWVAAAQQLQGQAQAALDSIGRAIALAPEDSSLHLTQASILLGLHQVDEAQSALARTSALDPNQLGAYLMGAQLALGRGDYEEAARLNRLAARVAPEHPQLAAVDGMLALRDGQTEAALKLVSGALQRQPDNTQLLYALGFIYAQYGSLAFAEQAFRRVLELVPNGRNLQVLIADLVAQQGRPADAIKALAPLLADADTATPVIKRQAGLLHLALNQAAEALPLLRDAFAAQPRDGAGVRGLMQAWSQLGTSEEARATLDAALATTRDSHDLWRARLELEQPGSDSAAAFVARWLQAMPDHLPALEARMQVEEMAGQQSAVEATARRIVELEPGRISAEQRIIQALLERDPPAAIAYIDTLIAKAANLEGQQMLRRWKAGVHDLSGNRSEAVAAWSEAATAIASQRLPLWSPSEAAQALPPLAPMVETPARRSLFLFGPPGSGVEAAAVVMGWMFPDFRADRFAANPPNDGFQNYNTLAALASGAMSGASLVEQWQQALPARGLKGGNALDWLLWWDNALLHALRPHLSDALVLFVVRDPRDMLLDWLAFDPVPPLALQAINPAAQWLAQVLEHILAVQERALCAHQLLKLDGIHNDPVALAAALGEALQVSLPKPAPGRGPARLPAGHWREYTQVLAEPFAVLAPVAVRLGYPEH